MNRVNAFNNSQRYISNWDQSSLTIQYYQFWEKEMLAKNKIKPNRKPKYQQTSNENQQKKVETCVRREEKERKPHTIIVSLSKSLWLRKCSYFTLLVFVVFFSPSFLIEVKKSTWKQNWWPLKFYFCFN